MEHSLKKCPNCGWSGYLAQKVTCRDCYESYYICPKCGKQLVLYENVPFIFSRIYEKKAPN